MDGIFITLLNMSISASWLIIAVIVLRFIMKKTPKWINCLLWGLVAVRLICPVTIESRFSLIPSAHPLPAEITYTAQPQINSGISGIDEAVNPVLSEVLTPVSGASANPTQIWTFVLERLWLLGTAAMLLYACVSYLQLRQKLRTSALWQDNIRICDNIGSPFILGILLPRIYIPSCTDEMQFPHIIAHEKAHLKRHDHWWKPLGFSILAVHWFNPLVWTAYILFCRDIELACDEKVIRDMNIHDAVSYSEALLSCSIDRRTLVVCPLAFGEVGVKERVKHVLHYRKPAFLCVLAGAMICFVMAVCFLTNPSQKTDYIVLHTAKSTPVNFISYNTNLREGSAGAVVAESWQSGRVMRSEPVPITGDTRQLLIYLDVLKNASGEKYTGVSVQLQTEVSELVQDYFAFPENLEAIGYASSVPNGRERVTIPDGNGVILATLVPDSGSSIRSFSCDYLTLEPERLADAAFALVIRAYLGAGPEEDEGKPETPGTIALVAVVKEILADTKTMLVVGKEDHAEYSVAIAHMESSPEPQIGDTVEIIYSGTVPEANPIQFSHVLMIRVLEDASASDAAALPLS